MRYSEDQIEEVRSRSDIVDVVGSYVKLEKKGSSYFGLCPFHNEKSPSFSVTPGKQMFYCFGCGEGGNVFSFVMKYENLTFVEAVKSLADKAGVSLPEGEMSPYEKEQQNKRQKLLDINREAAVYYHNLLKTENGKNAYNYFLEKRKLSLDTVVHFGLGASSMHSDELYRYMKSRGYEDSILKETGLFIFDEKGVFDRFRNRAMFPIMNINNKVIGFGGRVMGDGEPKYLNSPETTLFDKSRNLFGLNVAKSSRKNNLIICEGYMDVISMHQAGFDQAVASLGTALTPGHANLMKRYVKDILVCYDSDGAGTKAAIRAISILRDAGLRTKVINMKPYKDPDEFIKALGAEAFQERIDKAQNSFMFELSVLENNYDVGDPDGKTAFLNEVAKKLLVFRDNIERNNYLETVATNYFVNKDDLNNLVIKYAQQGGLMRDTSDDEPRGRNQEPGSLRKDVKKEQDDGIKKAQRMLLTWLIEDDRLFKPVSKYITPLDFTEGLYYQVAVMLFEQLEEGKLNPAKIISSFDDDESHSEVARLFNTELPDELTKAERQKAIDEIVYKVKKNSIDKMSLAADDIGKLQELIKEQNMLNNLHIIIN